MNISHLLTKSVTVQSCTGSDDFGKPSYAAQRPVPCKIVKKNSVVAGVSGVQIVPRTILETDQEIKDGDRYWPPGADVSNEEQSRIFSDVTSEDSLDGSYTLYRVEL